MADTLPLLNTDVEKWKKITKEIKEKYSELTVPEKSAFDVLCDFWRNSNFDPDECNENIRILAEESRAHGNNLLLKTGLQTFRELCKKYYTKNEDYFKAFQKAMGGRKFSRSSKSYGMDYYLDNKVMNLIFANTPVPVKVSKDFFTISDNQSKITIPIFESNEVEYIIKKDYAILIDDFVIDLPKNCPKKTMVSIVFELDSKGVLYVYGNVGNKRTNTYMYKTRLTI
jgi:hypothetical protein